MTLRQRFRGFCPVVIDVESGGLDPQRHPLLELAAVFLTLDTTGKLQIQETLHWHVLPFEGAPLDPAALAFNHIIPDHPFRFAVPEHTALQELFAHTRSVLRGSKCQRAVLVGHNAWFDLHMLLSAQKRSHLDKSPFHPFTTFDTATLGAVRLGHTVLSTLLQRAGLTYSSDEAHSALYDAERTAELFCWIVNHTPSLYGALAT